MKRPLTLLLVLAAAAAMLVTQGNAAAPPAKAAPAKAAPAKAAPGAGRQTVTYDHYSLMIDGHRIILQSPEFHYWRMPSPSLWPDILEKMKAAGFNAVSVYFDWAYHSPNPACTTSPACATSAYSCG
jgi:hypothetical protein